MWGNVSFWFALSLPRGSSCSCVRKGGKQLCHCLSVPALPFQSSVFQARELEHSGSADKNAFVPCSSLFLFDPFPVLLHACGGGEEQSYTLLRLDPVWVCITAQWYVLFRVMLAFLQGRQFPGVTNRVSGGQWSFQNL